ncbi:ribosome maturation factor RimM [Oscillospiraceae bacterium OttesenSCG-928-G22]|nr:ribosome maturation factor RimM [Oscillospiraceae bacterium OttesenSCG-928-G22]
MAKKRYLEAGVVAGTHGIRGTLRVKPWADSPAFLLQFDEVFLDGTPFSVLSATVHKSVVLMTLEGIDTIEKAMELRGRVLTIDREQVDVPDGRYFIQDLINLRVQTELGDVIGNITEVMNLPANDVYVVLGEKRYMIPAVPEFVLSVDIEGGVVTVRLLEGMAEHAN